MSFFLECCCQNAANARRAEAAGASRIELCEQMPLDGLTPTDENILATLAAVRIPVNVLVRCRAGSFVYSREEVDAMARDVERIRQLTVVAPDGDVRRVNAVVVGALTPEGDVDCEAMRQLIGAAGALPVTFHRAFDVCRHPLQAYDDIASLGIARLLTSGHAPSAVEGCGLLAELVKKSQHGAGPVILAGGGIRPHNIAPLAAATAATEFHSSCLEGWGEIN